MMRSNFLLLFCAVLFGNVSAFVGRSTGFVSPSSSSSSVLQVAVDPTLDTTSFTTNHHNGINNLNIVSLKDNKEIAHLQKKLKYWKQQHSEKEAAYKMYIHKQMVDNKMKPIYVRQGKIDTYKMRPVFDSTTEQIQTEIWTIKEKIKLTHAKLEEEERVLRVKQELELQLQNMHQQVATAQQQQDVIRQEAQSNLEAVKQTFTSKMDDMRQQSEQKLSDKEQQIQALTQDIRDIGNALAVKRQELNVKESVLKEMEAELQQKQTALQALHRERASLRALLRQSWKLLKNRVLSKFGNKNNNSKQTEEEALSANGTVHPSKAELVRVR